MCPLSDCSPTLSTLCTVLFRQSEGDSEVHKAMVQHWRMTRKYMLSTVSLSIVVYVNVSNSASGLFVSCVRCMKKDRNTHTKQSLF